MRPSALGLAVTLATASLAACGSEDSADDGGNDVVGQNVGEAVASEAAAAVPPAADAPAPPAAGGIAGDPLAALIESHELGPTFIAVLVDEALLIDPLDLEAIARSQCEGRVGCRAVVWFDRDYLPLALPVDARQTEASVFAYGSDLAGGETSQWNCTLFPEMRTAGRSCLPTTERML